MIPFRVGGRGYSLPGWEDGNSRRHSYYSLATAENLALIVAPRPGTRQLYGLGHLAALMGVPSLLVTENGTGDSKAFVSAYARQSVATARNQLPPGWLLLGDWGPDAEEAAKLGKSRFAEYGKAGVQAHNDGLYAKALSLFENALTIAGENSTLAKQRTPLHRYARSVKPAAKALSRA